MPSAPHRYQLRKEHVLRYLRDPVAMARQQFGAVLDDAQAQFLTAIIHGRSVAWRSGHGVGKSAAMALTILIFLYLYPGARVVATSVKRDQLSDVLWPECLKWINGSKLKPDYVWHAESIALKGREKEVFAVPRTGNSSEALQGFHADYLLILVDEASGVPDAVFVPLESTLTGKHNVVGMAGNPTRAAGVFFDAHHKNRSEYLTLHTSSEGHPRVKKDYAASMARKWGADSDVYRVRVQGEFPRGDPTAFIQAEAALAAQTRLVPPSGTIRIGVDVARFGDDRTVMGAVAGWHMFPDVRVYGKKDTQEVAGYVVRFANDLRRAFPGYGLQQVEVNVDDTGVGGGVTDALRAIATYENLSVSACNFGAEGDADYDNWAALAYGEVRDWLKRGQLPSGEPLHDDIVNELTTRRFNMTAKGKIRLEPKQDYKKRHGFSPDLADMACLAIAHGAPQSVVGIMPVAAREDFYDEAS